MFKQIGGDVLVTKDQTEMFLLVKKLQEIQRVKREGMLMTEAAQNELKHSHNEEEEEDLFGRGDHFDRALSSARGNAVSDSGLGGTSAQTMDHQLKALMHVLRHNQRVGGVQLTKDEEPESCFEDYRFLSEHMLSYVDPIGNSFMMPCQNPRHEVHGSNVYENEYQHHILTRRRSIDDPEETEVVEDEHTYCDLLVESRKEGHKSLSKQLNLSPEETEAMLSAYLTVRSAVELEVEKYRRLDCQPRLVEDMLHWQALNNYTLPTCFVPVNKDLAEIVTGK